MFKLKKQIEAHIQEIVFFFSLVIAFSSFLSGALYLALGSDNLAYVIGSFGSLVDRGLFTFLGYGFFYLSVMALHMGYITNFHVFNFRDLKKHYPVLLYSILAHIIVLTLFCNMLSVIQISLELSRSTLLTYGSGGMVGQLLSGAMYSGLGVYGSVLSLIALMGVTALLGGFFEIPDVVVAVKGASQITKKTTVFGIKQINSSLINGIQFLAKTQDMIQEATVTSTGHTNWINTSWNKANLLVTDHLHIYKNDEKVTEKKEVTHEKESKIEHKKVVKKDSKKDEAKVDLKQIAAKIEKKSIKHTEHKNLVGLESKKAAANETFKAALKKKAEEKKVEAAKVETKSTAAKIETKAVSAKANVKSTPKAEIKSTAKPEVKTSKPKSKAK